MKTQQIDHEDALLGNIGDNAQRLAVYIDSLVSQRREIKSAQKEEMDAFEHQMLSFLWRCRTNGLLSTASIARKVGISRQRLYEKWEKCGYVPSDYDIREE